MPCGVVGVFACVDELGGELVVVGENAGGEVSEGNHHRTGKCGRIDHDSRLETFGVG